jgi:hypothetical protein
MAKKTAKKKKSEKKKAPKATKPKRAKQPRLGGMEDMPAVPALDRVAESLASCREEKNTLVETEKGLIQRAMDLMHSNGRTIYKAHGIELVLVPGGDKLRVRLREDGESDNESGTEGEGDNGNEVEGSEN